MENRERMEQMMEEQINIRYRVDGEVVPEKELFLTMEEVEEHWILIWNMPEEYKKRNIYFLRNHSKKNGKNSKCLQSLKPLILLGFLTADSGTWTHTKSPPQDFESCASAIPPYPHLYCLHNKINYNYKCTVCQSFFLKKKKENATGMEWTAGTKN